MLKKILVYTLFILSLLVLLNCQINSQSFHITKYSTDNGLPDNRVNDIAQDSLGRIWIAMVSGIAMYDGYEWKKYGEKEGVPEVEYARIKVDEKGVIWFMPAQPKNSTLIYLKNSNWFKIAIDNNVKSIPTGLISFDIVYKADKPEIYLSSFIDGVIKFYNDGWSHIGKNDGLDCDTVLFLKINNNMLYVSSTSGLYFKNLSSPNTFEKFAPNVAKSLYNFIFPDEISKNNNLKIIGLTESELVFINNNKLTVSAPINIPSLGIFGTSSIALHSSGEVFLGNSAALFSFNTRTQKLTRIILEKPSSDIGASNIFIDYESNIWLSGLRGIYKLQYSTFKNYNENSGLLEDEVTAISENKNGDLFFGHNYGVSRLSSEKFRTISFIAPDLTHAVITRIIDMKFNPIDHKTYCASYKNGITIISDDRINWIKVSGISRYYALFINEFGKVFISTDKGQYLIENNSLCPFLPKINGLSRKLYISKDSFIYIANNTGLIRYNSNTTKFLRTNNSESDNIFTFYQHPNDGFLVGSAKGLYKLENDSLIKFNFNNQDITDPIYFIIQDSSKNVWLGTNNGVLRWDGKNLKRYNKSDGLAGNETNRAAGFVDSKGNVWIGTDEGVSMYTGNEPDYTSFPPKIMLLDFYDHDNFVYDINKDIILDPDKKNLTFNYRGLSFIDEKRNSYQIRLLERNGDHIDEFATNSSSIRLSNLAPGDYIFSVRVQNAKGIWSEWKSSAVITVQQHFYNKPVFYLGVLSILFLVAYLTNNYFQQKKYTKKLEAAVDVRTKDLKVTQQQLITSVNRYKGIVESQTDLVIRITESGTLTFVNDAYCAVFGKKHEDLIGKSFLPLIHPEDVELTLEDIKKLNIPPYRLTFEQRAFTMEGYRWFSWEGYAIHDHLGNIIEIQAVGRDITMQKEIEIELEKRVNERTIELQSLISQSPLAILTFDADGFLLTYNKIANEMLVSLENYLPPVKSFNIFREEFLCRNNYAEKLLNFDTANSFLLTNPIKIEDAQNPIYAKMENHFLVYRIYNVIFDESNKVFVLLLDDVTEQLNAEEISKRFLEEKIRISTIIKTIESERSRFATELHDGLGQLLTTAKLKLDVIKLKTEKNISEINEAVNILINAGDEIRRIINDLKPSDVERFGLISSIELLVERTRHDSGIKILLSVLSNFQITDKNFELIIYRIVQEALNNIVKHSQCNRATIEILTEQGELLLSIKDDGIGVDLTSKNENIKSYGIRNIKERVKSLNGKIEIESEPGKGFNYLIKIPI